MKALNNSAAFAIYVVLAASFLAGCGNREPSPPSQMPPSTMPPASTPPPSAPSAPPTSMPPAPGETRLPPREAIDACTGKAVGAACAYGDRGVATRGVCDDKPGIVVCRQGDSAADPLRVNPVTPQPMAPGAPGGQSGYSIEQAISDQAQLSTLAFDGLGFLTGNTCSDSFLPPGKVADFFGFQYLRDTTQAGQGHSTDFVTNAANNVWKLLNVSQRAEMLALAKTQDSLVNAYAVQRFPLMVAFRRQLDGKLPAGTTGLSKAAVMAYSANLYELDAKISLQRAQLFARVLTSLNPAQKATLDAMVRGGFNSWTALPNQVNDRSLSREQNVLVMTYASEMLGWYAGNVEADTYFCPERQGDYFGGFYMKDAPAIGNAGYTIDESITGDKGKAFINILTSAQKPFITGIVTTQKAALTGIVERRRAIASELRAALTGSVNEARVLALAREYGQFDGEISYYYAMGFGQVGKTLTSDQKARLAQLRGLDGFTCPADSAYLYSERISMPAVPNTDFLFK